ncbi:MAG TPA: TRAP transporter small permease [Casimicrobiaceae bacterium]|nr:TRAP transporter small permease [Casimicrobiaceae bacterium]
MSMFDAMSRVLERSSRWSCDFAGWLLAFMAVLINVEVAARYVFNTSTLIADEYSGYLFVWSTLLGFAYALQGGQFLRVETVVTRLGRRGQAASELVAAIAGLVVALVCTYATGLLLASALHFGTRSIQPSATPLWLPELMLPLAFAWLCVLYLHQIVATLRGKPPEVPHAAAPLSPDGT